MICDEEGAGWGWQIAVWDKYKTVGSPKRDPKSKTPPIEHEIMHTHIQACVLILYILTFMHTIIEYGDAY